MSDRSEQLDQMNKFAEELRKRGSTPVEVHNRAAILWLHDLQTTRKVQPRPMELQGEQKLEDMEYTPLKLFVGTYLSSLAQDMRHSLASELPTLRWLQDEVIRRQLGLKFGPDTIRVPSEILVRIVQDAHEITSGLRCGLADLRMVMQFSNQIAWSRTRMDCFILHRDDETRERQEVSRLITGKPTSPIPPYMTVHPRTFAEEFQRYEEEHMKVEFSIQERIDWQAGCIASLRNIATVIPSPTTLN